MKPINKQISPEKLDSFKSYLKGIDNLYMKFILTIIAIALVAIAMEIKDGIYVTGSVNSSIDGTVDVSGAIDTYEQN